MLGELRETPAGPENQQVQRRLKKTRSCPAIIFPAPINNLFNTPMNPYLTEIRKTFALAIPMVMGQLGQMGLHLIDAAMVGQVGVVSLAAIAFGGNIVGIFLIIGYGLASAVSVLVAQAYGGKQYERSGEVLKHGIVITFLYALAVAALMHWNIGFLHYFGQPEDVVETSKLYVIFLVWSLIPTLVYQCLRTYSEALNRPWMPFVILAGGFFLNIFLNWILIFGKLGMPAYGAAGAGLATLLARGFMMFAMAAVVLGSSRYDIGRSLFDFFHCSRKLFSQLLAIGVPTGFQLLFEAGSFTVAAILMGWIGTNSLAAHQIAINIAAMTFMIPLGVSFAVAIRVGQAAGREDRPAIRRIGFSSFLFVIGFMSCTATIIFLTRHQLPWFFLDNNAPEAPEVVFLTAQFLIVASLFQVFDGLQVVSMGALRGIADVKVPTVLVFFGYWVLALPLAYFLAFNVDLQGLGVWLGLMFGLAIASIVLSTRFHLTTHPDRAIAPAV